MKTTFWNRIIRLGIFAPSGSDGATASGHGWRQEFPDAGPNVPDGGLNQWGPDHVSL